MADDPSQGTVWTCVGGTSGITQTVNRGELQAVVNVMHQAQREGEERCITIVTDSQYVYGRWLRGTRDTNENVDLWARFWEFVDQGCCMYALRKTRAHRDLQEALAGGDFEDYWGWQEI